MRYLVIPTLVFLLSSLVVFPQKHQDTTFSMLKDTMIILYYQNNLLNSEKCFVNNKMVAYTLWYYKKDLYGYTLYENKKRKTQIAIKKEFYIDGTPKIQGSTLNRKLHGKKNTFYSNGKLQCDCKYKNGKKDSMLKSFTEGGITEHQGNCKDGRKNGEHIFYHPN